MRTAFTIQPSWAKFEMGVLRGGTVQSTNVTIGHLQGVPLAEDEITGLDRWRQLEIARLNDAFVYRLNGRTLGAVTRFRLFKDGQEQEAGPTPIGLWALAGAASFRRIEIRSITELPPEFVQAAK